LSIAKNIKKLRDMYDLSQQDLADIAGVTNKAVSTWETGMKEPRMGAIEKIAARFNLKKSNLIEENGMDNIEFERGPETIAAHHDGEEWTAEELEEIERFKEFVRMKRKQQNT